MGKLKVCSECVMDESDPSLILDNKNVCNYCNDFFNKFGRVENGGPFFDVKNLQKEADYIKENQKDKDFDVIVGLSGGADSSYTALITKKLGLRAAYVHFDSGWNTAVSSNNIKQTLDFLNGELFTHVTHWETMKSVQKSFFINGEINCDIPQDHAFLAILIKFSKEMQIPYIVSGHNFATEFVMPMSWGYTSHDSSYIKRINSYFEASDLSLFPQYNPYKYLLAQKLNLGLNFIRPLNFYSYDKDKIQNEMKDLIGWQSYKNKHGESKFTSFFQNYYLFEKFGIDKRKAHYSSSVLSGLMTRDDALSLLSSKPYKDNEIEFQIDFFAEKLGFTSHEFIKIMNENKNTNTFMRSLIISGLRKGMHRGSSHMFKELFSGNLRKE